MVVESFMKPPKTTRIIHTLDGEREDLVPRSTGKEASLTRALPLALGSAGSRHRFLVPATGQGASRRAPRCLVPRGKRSRGGTGSTFLWRLA